jgi:MFS family permease
MAASMLNERRCEVTDDDLLVPPGGQSTLTAGAPSVPLETGVAFLPMALIGAVLTPFSARLAERLGSRTLISSGLAVMAAGLAVIAAAAAAAPTWAVALMMVSVGVAALWSCPR